uniref:T-complex 11 like 2 n=1 Tax=Syphacia muris TaxID=451379 RepID=A0A0N5A7J7_9BILA
MDQASKDEDTGDGKNGERSVDNDGGKSKEEKFRSAMPVLTSESEQQNALPSWVAGASPARFVTLDELMDMSKAMENMALVHEMAVNPEFSISETSSNPIEKAVKDCVHKIFWEKMRDDLNKQPPDYTNAFLTLLDIKKMIFDLLTPQHVRLKMEIDSRLDEVLLKQQLDNNCLDWKQLAEYLICLLGRLCAPIRDEMVKKLKEKTDVVDILRGSCELLEIMKVDMANFEMKQNRAFIEDHSAVYERNQFLKLLEKDPSILFLLVISVLFFFGTIISNAYMQLLEWDSKNPYPSTMLVDRNRLEQLSNKYLQLITCTSCILVTCMSIGQNFVDTAEFKQKLKEELMAITVDLKAENVSETLEAIYLHCDKRAGEIYNSKKEKGLWTEEKSKSLKSQIMSLKSEKNPVRNLMRNVFFVLFFILHFQQPSKQQQLPAGVSMVREELNSFTATFIRLVNHNRKVFGVFYGGIIKKLIRRSPCPFYLAFLH